MAALAGGRRDGGRPTTDRRTPAVTAAPRAVAALIALAVSAFCYVAMETLPVGILPLVATDLDVTLSHAGLLVTGYAITVAIVSVPLTYVHPAGAASSAAGCPAGRAGGRHAGVGRRARLPGAALDPGGRRAHPGTVLGRGRAHRRRHFPGPGTRTGHLRGVRRGVARADARRTDRHLARPAVGLARGVPGPGRPGAGRVRGDRDPDATGAGRGDARVHRHRPDARRYAIVVVATAQVRILPGAHSRT